jgi:hypothetical protein
MSRSCRGAGVVGRTIDTRRAPPREGPFSRGSAVAVHGFDGLLEHRLDVVVLRLAHRNDDQSGNYGAERRGNPQADVPAIDEGTVHARESIEDNPGGCRFNRIGGKRRRRNGGDYLGGDDWIKNGGANGATNLDAW